MQTPPPIQCLGTQTLNRCLRYSWPLQWKGNKFMKKTQFYDVMKSWVKKILFHSVLHCLDTDGFIWSKTSIITYPSINDVLHGLMSQSYVSVSWVNLDQRSFTSTASLEGLWSIPYGPSCDVRDPKNSLIQHQSVTWVCASPSIWTLLKIQRAVSFGILQLIWPLQKIVEVNNGTKKSKVQACNFAKLWVWVISGSVSLPGLDLDFTGSYSILSLHIVFELVLIKY